MTTNLVVADASRTEKTICLAVSPSLKAYGIPGRPRLFEVVQKIREANARRRISAPNHQFTGSSYYTDELKASPGLSIDYIIAAPRMALYVKYSTQIYNIYLNYVAPEDIHVYSIDEVIMDIVAKHIPPDKNGVRIAELDEMSYRRLLWNHRPLTDFWRIGRGYAKKLEAHGLYTMGDIARCSIGKSNEYHNEELLYHLFGINAELLIDHAWGWEPCTMKDIKSYKPASSSLCSGQVLQYAYDFQKARLIVREMIDLMVLDLIDKELVTDQIVLTIGYDIENLTNPDIRKLYKGEITTDQYGRRIPKHAHGTANLDRHTASARLITDASLELYDRIINKNLLIRRITVSANHVIDENAIPQTESFEQLDLFTDYAALQKKQEEEKEALKKEKQMQQAMLSIKKKYGKNAVLKGMNLEDGAMTLQRNNQIGGHQA